MQSYYICLVINYLLTTGGCDGLASITNHKLCFHTREEQSTICECMQPGVDMLFGIYEANRNRQTCVTAVARSVMLKTLRKFEITS